VNEQYRCTATLISGLESKTLILQVVSRNGIQKVSKSEHAFFFEESCKLSGKVKRCINGNWCYKYPQAFFQSPFHDLEAGAWCAVSALIKIRSMFLD
jgi:hypothetical protein